MNIRKAAKGQSCTLNVAGYCTYNPEQTVLAHIRGIGAGDGMAKKPDDLAAVFACDTCHGLIDGRIPGDDEFKTARTWYLLRGLYRTHKILWEMK